MPINSTLKSEGRRERERREREKRKRERRERGRQYMHAAMMTDATKTPTRIQSGNLRLDMVLLRFIHTLLRESSSLDLLNRNLV